MPEGPRSAPVRLTCSLLAGAAVDALAEEVGVAVVACVLLDHAQVDPIAACGHRRGSPRRGCVRPRPPAPGNARQVAGRVDRRNGALIGGGPLLPAGDRPARPSPFEGTRSCRTPVVPSPVDRRHGRRAWPRPGGCSTDNWRERGPMHRLAVVVSAATLLL